MSYESAIADFLGELGARGAPRAPATLGEIWTSEWNRTGLDTMTGVGQPLTDAQDDLVKAIEGAAGKPIESYAAERGVRLGSAVTVDQRIGLLGALADTLPDDKRSAIEPLKDARKRAADKAQKLERDAADVASGTYGLSGHATAFLAGVARQTVDPVNVAAMVATAPLGGPIAGPILPMIGRQAAAGAISQAAVEPYVQPARGELGLESGFGRAMGNIAEAAIGSAGLAAIFRGGAAAIRYMRQPAEAAGAINPPPRPETPPDLETRTSEAPTGSGPIEAPAAPETHPAYAAAAAEDLEAAARVVERDQVIEAAAPADTAEVRAATLAQVDEAARAIDEGRPIGDAPDAPVPSWLTESRAAAVEFSEKLGVTEQIRTLATEGRTAAEIATALGDRLSVEDVRAVRDHLGIARAGDLGGVALGRMPTEAPRIESMPLPPDVTRAPLTRMPAGPAMWANRDFDVPVRVLDDPPQRGPDGRFYQKVEAEGRESFVPLDELRAAPDAPGIPDVTPTVKSAKKGRAAAEPSTWSLFEFLASRGGLRADPEVMAILGEKNRFVPGFGALIRKTGMGLDKAREAATELGYIHGEMTGGDSTRIHDLLALIDEEARGRRQYRIDTDARGTKADATAEGERNRAVIESEVDGQFRDAGMDPAEIDPALRSRVAEIFEKEGGRDALVAFERAIMEDAERFERTANARREAAPDIPGWDVPDDARPASGGRGKDAPGGSRGEPARDAGGDAAGESARPGGDADRGAAGQDQQQQLGDPALAREADLVLAEAGGDLEIILPNPDGTMRRVSAREALAQANDDAHAAAELIDCIGGDIPF